MPACGSLTKSEESYPWQTKPADVCHNRCKPRLHRGLQLRSGNNPRSHASEKRRPELGMTIDSGLCGSFRTFLTAGAIRKEGPSCNRVERYTSLSHETRF